MPKFTKCTYENSLGLPCNFNDFYDDTLKLMHKISVKNDLPSVLCKLGFQKHSWVYIFKLIETTEYDDLEVLKQRIDKMQERYKVELRKTEYETFEVCLDKMLEFYTTHLAEVKESLKLFWD